MPRRHRARRPRRPPRRRRPRSRRHRPRPRSRPVSRSVRPPPRVRVPFRVPLRRSPAPPRRVRLPRARVRVLLPIVRALPGPVSPGPSRRHRAPGPATRLVRQPRPPDRVPVPPLAPRARLRPLPARVRVPRPRDPVPVAQVAPARPRAMSVVRALLVRATTRSPRPRAWDSRVAAPARVALRSPVVRVLAPVRLPVRAHVRPVCRVRVAPAGCPAPTRR